MARKEGVVLNFIIWLTGVVVSLAVGFGLINGTLRLPDWIGGMTQVGWVITSLAGWVVVVTTIVAAVLAVLHK